MTASHGELREAFPELPVARAHPVRFPHELEAFVSLEEPLLVEEAYGSLLRGFDGGGRCFRLQLVGAARWQRATVTITGTSLAG
jgi:hypothetical protein